MVELKISSLNLFSVFLSLFSIIFNLYLSFSDFYAKTYDSYVHIFFANHYRLNWFQLYESKWYGGISLASYPPLVHQLIALLSIFFSLELSYQIVTFLVSILFPFSVYSFSKIFVSQEASKTAYILSIFLPSFFIVNFGYGQLPTVFSLTLFLLSMSSFNQYLLEGNNLFLLKGILLQASSISSHHFTPLFFQPATVTVVIITRVLKDSNFKVVLRRVLTYIVPFSITSIIVIIPFWINTLNYVMQTPIPHFTRLSVIQDFDFLYSVILMHGAFTFLYPLTIYKNRKNIFLLPLILMGVVFFILGLGGSTPIPNILFGDVWNWLTYDRFTLWASILFLPVVSEATLGLQRFSKILLAFLIVVFFAFTVFDTMYFDKVSPMIDADEIIHYMNNDLPNDYRYITLGFGEPSMIKINIECHLPSFDGCYPTGRTIPAWTKSGLTSLDGSLYSSNGLAILNQFLVDADEYNLKWVLNNRNEYDFILLNSNFNLVNIFSNGVQLWEKNGVPPIEKSTPKSNLLDYSWGIFPIIIFSSALSVTFNEYRQKHFINKIKLN